MAKVAPMPPPVGNPAPRSTALMAAGVVDTAEELELISLGPEAGTEADGQDAGRARDLPAAANPQQLQRVSVRGEEQPAVSPTGQIYPPLPPGVDRSIPDIGTSTEMPCLVLAVACLTMWPLCARRLCVGVVPGS